MKPKLMSILIALLAVYIFWGATYLGMKIAIDTIPPFIMAGVRFIIAGIILYTVAIFNGVKKPGLEEWKEAGIVGILLLLGGNGVVAWAEQKVPSGIASLLLATVPLWIILFNWLGGKKEKPTPSVIIGIILGILGMGVLVWHSGTDQHLDLLGVIALLMAAISWSWGSIYSLTAKLPKSPMLSTAMQMLVGGGALLFLSFFMGNWSKLNISQISFSSYLALGYLIVFGSIAGYSAYIWLLKNAEPALASTYAFVNPIVAVFLGWLIVGEELTVNSLLSAVIIVASVAIITVFREPKKAEE